MMPKAPTMTSVDLMAWFPVARPSATMSLVVGLTDMGIVAKADSDPGPTSAPDFLIAKVAKSSSTAFSDHVTATDTVAVRSTAGGQDNIPKSPGSIANTKLAGMSGSVDGMNMYMGMDLIVRNIKGKIRSNTIQVPHVMQMSATSLSSK
ncbi:hypothetical protein FBULB1_10454 [Fusarium bulbicola]|nr:hypothetical protein FBULB1_10454 [Fusarium bulbicola]